MFCDWLIRLHLCHHPPSHFKEEPVMLVLSRKVGERIVIADNITIVVHKVAGNRVSLGVEAPRDVRVVRGELRKLVEAIAISPVASVAPLGDLPDEPWTRLPGTVRAR